MGLSIIPLNTGTIYTDKSLVTPRKNFGQEFGCPTIIWYIDGAKKKILVDTGFKDAKQSAKIHAPQRIERKPEQELKTALAAIGVQPEDIDVVILTHLHWDHSQNNDLFVNAQFVVQKTEMQYAICPLPSHNRLYEAITIGLRPCWLNTPHWTVINGDEEIVDGVSVIHTPGHTPGFQSVLVKTTKGVYAIAADNVTVFENWGNVKDGTHVLGGTYVNLDDYWRSIAKLEKAADFILPGHDPAIFKNKHYP
jgi:N-acyl homoserine lactone hydrolase